MGIYNRRNVNAYRIKDSSHCEIGKGGIIEAYSKVFLDAVFSMP